MNNVFKVEIYYSDGSFSVTKFDNFNNAEEYLNDGDLFFIYGEIINSCGVCLKRLFYEDMYNGKN